MNFTEDNAIKKYNISRKSVILKEVCRIVTYKGYICTGEFDEAIKKVGQRDYTEIGKVLRAATERSMRVLKYAVAKKKGRSNVK